MVIYYYKKLIDNKIVGLQKSFHTPLNLGLQNDNDEILIEISQEEYDSLLPQFIPMKRTLLDKYKEHNDEEPEKIIYEEEIVGI